MSDKVKVDAELVYVREGEEIPQGAYVGMFNFHPSNISICAQSRWIIKLPDNFKVPEPPPKLREVTFSEAASHMANSGEARPKSYLGVWFSLDGDTFVDETGDMAAYWINRVNEPWIIKEKA